MIHAIDVAGAKCERGDAAGCGLGRDHHDVGATAFAVSDKIERLGAGILGAVAAEGPFAENTAGKKMAKMLGCKVQNLAIKEREMVLVRGRVGHGWLLIRH